MDEAMLTGESTLVTKIQIDDSDNIFSWETS